MMPYPVIQSTLIRATAGKAKLSAGRKRKGRPVDGILLLDKPQGLTSNGALQRVKRILQAAKAGHTGALDPLATGVLPLCLGEATKVSQYLLESDKGYQTDIRFGIRTDTADAEGEVIAERPTDDLDETKVVNALSQFRGHIKQLPPMYSALKHKGQPLYKLAREGKEVERKPRPVTIHELELVAFEGDTATLNIRCSKGTYVRTIADDLGEALGCGAHVTRLRRTLAGSFQLEDCITLAELEALAEQQGSDAVEALLKPADLAICDWPAVNLPAASAGFVKHGQAVMVTGLPEPGTLVRLYDEENRFFGIGEALDDGRVSPRRLVKEQPR